MGGQNFTTLGPVPDAQNDLVSTTAINQTGLATVVPALTNKRVYVHGLLVASQASIALTFLELSAAGATVSFPLGTLGLNGGTPLSWRFTQYPLFTVGLGNAVAFSVSAQVGGRLIYLQG